MYSSLQKIEMRLKEFLTEQQLTDVHDALDIAALSLPYTYMMPELPNSNFYNIYRFGIAIAAARGDTNKDGVHQASSKTQEFRPSSEWGQNLIVSSFDPNIGKILDKALTKIDKKGKKPVSTPGSEEMKDTSKSSPVNPFKGYAK